MCGVSALLSATCYSQTAPAAEPESTLTFNVGAVSDYRYRGISQTGTKPAVQFGADYTDKSGFYVGTWNSTITWIKDTGTANTKGPLETDLYGGYRGAINDDVTYDVGVLQYLYSGNNLASVTGYANANTTEIYGAINYGPAYIKLSDSVTNFLKLSVPVLILSCIFMPLFFQQYNNITSVKIPGIFSPVPGPPHENI